MSKKDASSEGRAPESAKPRLSRSATFPGGSTSSKEVLRLAMDRAPLAELLAHGASSPEVEICGVLVGYVGEDSAGKFVHVLAAIRGEQAREQGSHVTFTHETWNHIHSEMDRAYTSLEIVGWYHTHPGFGVFLSDMDAFIHQNFFGQPHQIALVYDPLAGKTAVFTLRDAKLVPLPRYWREGRAIELDVPSGQEGPSVKSGAVSSPVSGKGAAELATIRESLARVEMLVREPRSRTWTEDWLVPTLLLALILLVSLQFFLTSRGESPVVRDLAARYLMLLELQRTGEVDIRDNLGRRVALVDPTDRAQGTGAAPPPSPAPPRTTAPGGGERR